MLGICGYNFCFDKNALDNVPTNLQDLTDTKLENGIYDHYSVTRDTAFVYNNEIPTVWDFFTLMDADFNENINAGNFDILVEQVDSIRIKRRVLGEFNWITLADIPINTVDDFKFSLRDLFNASGIEYEYAFVPVLNNVEGGYISSSIKSEFKGVFICDADTIYKLYAEVGYGSLTSVQKVGVFEPVGSKYPIIVANGETDYQQGSVDTMILNADYEQTHRLDRDGIVQAKNVLDKFLKNKRAKILKDWNGNIWLCIISGSPSYSYNNAYGMGTVKASFNWIEQGDPNNQEDLYYNGLTGLVV